VLDLTRALRDAGIPVAVSDGLDALRVAGIVDLADRGQLREGLAAALVKSAGHRPAFDLLFDVFFPARTGAAVQPADAEPSAAGRPRDVGDFLADLAARVLDGDDAAMAALALEAVDGYGRVDQLDGSVGWFGYRVWRTINLAGLLRRVMESAPDDALANRLARDDAELRLQRFREAVDNELRRRLAESRGPQDVARRAVRSLPEDVDFFRVSADDEADMRRAVRPLARRLATRLAVRRRRARGGAIDVRRTVRHSLSTGGVPLDLHHRARRASRPELVLLCDISGSVAAFSRFTLMFCHALQGQFSRVRSFAFIDTVDEVTALFEHGDFSAAMRRMATEADVVWLDGHSDYGHALSAFHARYLDAVTPRTTVLVLGDARNNYRAANTWVLRELGRRARRVYFLNPEPTQHWGSGDSVAQDYATAVDGMVECRNLRQLAEFVETLG
jgi:uncharacterized protein with von Willebrand factor type A (vWA) domain